MAGGRISARFHRSHRITVDDGFFVLAITTLIAGTTLLYLDIPYIYLQEDVEAGLRAPPANLIPQLISSVKLQVATSTLLGTTIMSVKFSFLFFFRSLIQHQKNEIIWWWCILVLLVATTPLLMFSNLMTCPYFDQSILGRSSIVVKPLPANY